MKILALNHKMNLTYDEINSYITEMDDINYDSIKLIVCPSSIYLNLFQDVGYLIGSQNVSDIESGALTGEVSAKQLSSININYCIVGHSERRKILNETDLMINKKIKLLLENNIKPILCVGETLKEKGEGLTLEVIKNELLNDLVDVSDVSSVVIAYEPLWAIGTGKVPTCEEIDSVILSIKKIIFEQYSAEVKVLYGGSVSENSIENLESISSIDGYLVGGAGLKPASVKKMIESMRN